MPIMKNSYEGKSLNPTNLNLSNNFIDIISNRFSSFIS